VRTTLRDYFVRMPYGKHAICFDRFNYLALESIFFFKSTAIPITTIKSSKEQETQIELASVVWKSYW
jgi:hypothetical protein